MSNNKEILEKILNFDKDATLTGSIFVGEFPNQDIDIFCHTKESMIDMLYTIYHMDKMLLIDDIEKWKFENFRINGLEKAIIKLNLLTIKFKYNLFTDINIIYKKNCKTTFDILSTFDMDVVCKGIDLQTKNELDLTCDSHKTKIANINKFNKNYLPQNLSLFSFSRLLRQFTRVIKYHKRGFNTDNVTKKYIEIIDKFQNYENIFKSDIIDEKVEEIKNQGEIIKKIFTEWLNTHSINDDELILIDKILKKM